MILIAAGSNLPISGVDSQQLVFSAFSAVDRFARILARSPLYESPAWPDPADPAFVNAVVRVETELDPPALLAALHAVEAAFGRRRTARNAPRTLDLDLLGYNDVVSDGPNGLALPHPRLRERDFVLAPLCDVAPDWRPPGGGPPASAMLAGLPKPQARRISGQKARKC